MTAKHKRTRLRIIVAAVVIATLAIPAFAATTSWKCGTSGCKYDQTRVKYEEPLNGVFTVQQHQI